MTDTGNSSSEYHGRYTRAFLDQLVGEGKYTVKTYSLDLLDTPTYYDAALQDLHSQDVSLGYMSDTKLTLVWLHDYPGWLRFCEPLGISIKYSPKIAKRLTVMTRLTYLYATFKPGDLKIDSVKPDEFTTANVPDNIAVRFLDGANVISRELLERMITNGSYQIDKQFRSHCLSTCDDECKIHGRGNPWEKDMINRAVDRSGSFSLRVTTPDGLIKGDAICVPRAQIPGENDILYCSENIKPELITGDFIYVLAEPHPGVKKHEFSRKYAAPPPVWSDDQSMSWLGDWLYPKDQLAKWLKSFANSIYNDLAEGNYPNFFTDSGKLDDQHSIISQFQSQAVQWQERGLGLRSSIFLQERIGQGAVNQLANKRRWPVPCAMYVHVANDSWLHMAGYYNPDTEEHPWPFNSPHTPKGYVWYFEEIGRLVYNDEDFADLYDRHGGWDLDDSVKAHYRTMNGKKVVVIVRSPNSMGEYDIKSYVPDTFAPIWENSDGTVLEFPEISGECPQFLEDLDITYERKSLSPPKSDLKPYTKEILEHAIEMACQFRGVFGRRANADMAYFASTGDYRRRQLAPIEAIVDACTQEQSDDALALIMQDTENIIAELRQMDIVVDRTLWEQRIKRFYPKDMTYAALEWTRLAEVHNALCEIFQKKYFRLAQKAVENIDPEIFRLGKMFSSKGADLVNWYYELASQPRKENEKNADFYHRINTSMCDLLTQLEQHVIYNNVLAMASYVYTTRHSVTDEGNIFKDTVLFQGGKPHELSIFKFYLEAVQFYGIGVEDWYVTKPCSNCGNRFWTEDRVVYQAFLLNGKRCNECLKTTTK